MAVPDGTPAGEGRGSRRQTSKLPLAVAGGAVAAVGLAVAAFALTRGTPPPPTAPERVETPEAARPTGAAADPDRRAVEALRPHATEVVVRRRDGTRVTLGPADPVPPGPLAVVQVRFKAAGPPFPGSLCDVLVPAVRDLRHLEGIEDRYLRVRPTPADLAALADGPVAAGLGAIQLGLELTPETLDTLKRFPRLTSLSVRARTADDALLGRLGELPGLTFLSLSGLGVSGRVTAAGFEALGRLKVPGLSLVECKRPIDPAAARAVAGMPGLTDLGLMWTPVEPGALAEVARARGLTTLNLYSSPGVTDAEIAPLKGLAGPKRIRLFETRVTEGGAAGLSAALPGCEVEWGGKTWKAGAVAGAAPPSEDSGPDRRAAEMLRPHGAELVVRMASGQRITLKPTDPVPDGRLELVQVHFADPKGQFPNTFCTDVLVPAMRDLRHLEWLNDAHVHIRATAADLATLADAPFAANLVQLYLGFELTPETLGALKRLPRLARLNAYAQQADDALLGRLGELPTLTNLGLCGLGKSGRVTAAGFEALARLPVLSLGLIHYTVPLDPAAARALAGMPALRDLNLMYARLAPKAVAALAQSRGLTVLSLYGATGVTNPELDPFRGMTGLKRLILSRTDVTEAGVKGLSAALPKCDIEWDGKTWKAGAAGRR
jgi:hypothetical protein